MNSAKAVQTISHRLGIDSLVSTIRQAENRKNQGSPQQNAGEVNPAIALQLNDQAKRLGIKTSLTELPENTAKANNYSDIIKNAEKTMAETKAGYDRTVDAITKAKKKQYDDTLKTVEELPTAAKVALLPATSVMSVINPITSIAMSYKGTGKLDGRWRYDDSNLLSAMTNSIRSSVAEEAGKLATRVTGNEFIGSAISFVTGLVPSIADSFAVSKIPGGTLIFGFNAAQNRAIELYDQGADASQIVAGALADGIAEALFEKVSIEGLTHPERIANTFLRILAQAGVEASEEALTTISHYASDALIRGEGSDFGQVKRSYIENGYSEEKATQAAWCDMLGNIALDMLGGFISGGASAGIYSAASNAVVRKSISNLGKEISSSGKTEQTIADGINSARTTEAYRVASKLKQDIDNGKKVSDYDLGKVYIESNTKATIDATNRQNLAEYSGTSLGVSDETVRAVADVASKNGAYIQFVAPQQLEVFRNVTDQNGNTIGRESVGFADGLYDTKRDIILINANLDTDTAIRTAVGHEVTHAIEGTDAYARVERVVRNILGSNFDTQVDSILEARSVSDDTRIDRAKAEKEVIAKYIGENIFDEAFAKRVSNASPSFSDSVLSSLNVLKAFLGDRTAKVEEAFRKGLQQYADRTVTVADRIDGAINIDGNQLFNINAMIADEETYKGMLHDAGYDNEKITELFDTIDKVIEKVQGNLEALDFAWDADIDDRGFSPVKPNSDPLYKISIDFSTLCRKRILQQMVQRNLQEMLNRTITKEESISIRNKLKTIQEEGRQIEVACALCYVESARMKSFDAVKRFMNNRDTIIRDYLHPKPVRIPRKPSRMPRQPNAKNLVSLSTVR